MRDANRIYPFCQELAQIWAENAPDWRFGQLVLNVLGDISVGGRDPFFSEEDEMLQYLRDYFKEE